VKVVVDKQYLTTTKGERDQGKEYAAEDTSLTDCRGAMAHEPSAWQAFMAHEPSAWQALVTMWMC